MLVAVWHIFIFSPEFYFCSKVANRTGAISKAA
jgi:hypothetical protein